MDSLFWLKTAASFVTAGIWIAGSTMLAEKLGSKIGGLIANLPSNILVSMIFVALSQDRFFAAEAVRTLPLGMAANTIFIFVMIISLRYGILLSALLGLLGWLAAILAAGKAGYSGWTGGIIIYLAVMFITFLIAEYVLKIPSAPRIPKAYRPYQILIRALFAGSIVAGTVVVAQLAGPFWTGLFASFPAVLLSTLVILAVNQSPQFARAAGKILLVSSSNIVVYIVMLHLTYPPLGIALGTVISFIASVVWVALMRPLLSKIG